MLVEGDLPFQFGKDFKFKHFHSHVLTNHFENVLTHSTLNLEDCERNESKSDFKNGRKIITMSCKFGSSYMLVILPSFSNQVLNKVFVDIFCFFFLYLNDALQARPSLSMFALQHQKSIACFSSPHWSLQSLALPC